MSITHVERLKNLGEKIINSGGYCGSSTSSISLCETVGLMMIQPVTTGLKNFKDEVTEKIKKNMDKQLFEKKKIIDDALIDALINFTELQKILNLNENIYEKVFEKFNNLNDDQYEALYILYNIIYTLHPIKTVHPIKTDASKFFIIQIFNLMIKIITNGEISFKIDDVNKQNYELYNLYNIQNGGGDCGILAFSLIISGFVGGIFCPPVFAVFAAGIVLALFCEVDKK